jgi:hypothetical protein
VSDVRSHTCIRCGQQFETEEVEHWTSSRCGVCLQIAEMEEEDRLEREALNRWPFLMTSTK